jgi:hypothetical protein
MDMERPLRIRSREGISYSGRSLRRISSALTSNTPASASPGSAPWRTSALDVAGARRGGGTASTTGVGRNADYDPDTGDAGSGGEHQSRGAENGKDRSPGHGTVPGKGFACAGQCTDWAGSVR